MSVTLSRRRFILDIGVAVGSAVGSAVAASALPTRALAWASAPELLYPPTDLSYFDSRIAPRASDIRFGYAAITWGGNDTQAIDDISEAGYRGIQLRSSAADAFGGRPKAL